MPDPTLQQQIDDARAEMVFREEQLFARMSAENLAAWPEPLRETYDKARDQYLTLLMEYRLSQLVGNAR